MNRTLLWRIVAALTPLLLAGFYLFLLVYQAERVAITDDARFYMDAAQSYANYLERGWNGFKYFDKRFIDTYWHNNHEHPSFAKLLMASGYLVHKKFGVMRETVSYRVGISVLAAVTLLFLFSFVHRAFSFRAAIFASLFFIFLPRTFFHARVATLDFTVGATCFIFVYCYWRGLSSRFWAWMTGVAFGLALASKLNAPFMVAPVLVHYFFVKRHDLLRRPVRTVFAPQFVSMLLFSIPLFFALWPWLWHDTIARFKEYVAFHVNHYGISMYYLRDIYSTPRPPWSAPFVMALVTTPLLTMLCAVFGLFFYRWHEEMRGNAPMMLVVLSAFVAIGTVMFLPAPFYSGVKLFQPFFPFLAILAGVGLWQVLDRATILPMRLRYALFFLVYLPAIVAMIDLRHDHLSYYSELIGGTKGAAKYGFETHYYDLFYYDLVQFFNRELKNYTAVAFDPNGKEYPFTSNYLKRAKLLTPKFAYTDDKDASYYVITHEYRWREYPDLLRKHKWRRPVYILRRQGIPLVTVYRRGEETSTETTIRPFVPIRPIRVPEILRNAPKEP